MNSTPTPCEFCSSPGGAVLWQNDLCRVVRVDEPDYPGFCRVILRRHAREMTDLAPAERDALKARLATARTRIDSLLERLPPDDAGPEAP